MIQDARQTLANDMLTIFQGPVWLAVFAAIFLIFALGGCRVLLKSGFHPLVGLLLFVPIVNLAVFLFLAFTRWPVEREPLAPRSVGDSAHPVGRR